MKTNNYNNYLYNIIYIYLLAKYLHLIMNTDENAVVGLFKIIFNVFIKKEKRLQNSALVLAC